MAGEGARAHVLVLVVSILYIMQKPLLHNVVFYERQVARNLWPLPMNCDVKEKHIVLN